jgi:hypothetical protein
MIWFQNMQSVINNMLVKFSMKMNLRSKKSIEKDVHPYMYSLRNDLINVKNCWSDFVIHRLYKYVKENVKQCHNCLMFKIKHFYWSQTLT